MKNGAQLCTRARLLVVPQLAQMVWALAPAWLWPMTRQPDFSTLLRREATL